MTMLTLHGARVPAALCAARRGAGRRSRRQILRAHSGQQAVID
jgi:hypothetical protein